MLAVMAADQSFCLSLSIQEGFPGVTPKRAYTCHMRMLKEVLYVSAIGALVLAGGVFTLKSSWMLGPMMLALSMLPVAGLILAGKSVRAAVPDLVFGGIDTGLLSVPAIAGGVNFGAIGALAGAVVGDAVTDGIAGFFEGGIARWLRSKGIEASRDPVTTSLGKMAGCLVGAGLVLTVLSWCRIGL